MAIISLVIQPLREIVAAAPAVLASLAGFGCIQDFLLLKEVQSENNAKYLETGDASDDKIENQRDIMETHAVGTASDKPTPKGCVARFCSASIAPQGKPDKSVLHKLELSVEEDEFLIVSGPTGCGKSTFLESLLYEAQTVAGSAIVESCPNAYCGQTPWIKNASIKNNIIGYEEFDEEWYDSPLEACLLKEDLENLPSGDLTDRRPGATTCKSFFPSGRRNHCSPCPLQNNDMLSFISYCAGFVFTEENICARRHLWCT